jgi:hypothetical protein
MKHTGQMRSYMTKEVTNHQHGIDTQSQTAYFMKRKAV